MGFFATCVYLWGSWPVRLATQALNSSWACHYLPLLAITCESVWPGLQRKMARTGLVLSPGQTESQVDASWKLGSNCDSVWPGLACTCVDLEWLALTLVEIKFAHKSEQVFHRLATQPKSTQVEWLSLTYYYLQVANDIEDMRVLARKLASSFGHPMQVSTQVQLGSTCDYLPVRLTRA